MTPEQSFTITYHHGSLQDASEPMSSIRNEINLTQVASSSSALQGLPEKADQTFVVYTKIQKMSRNRYVPFGYFNHTTWKIQKDPTVPVAGLPRNQWDKHQFGITTGPGPVWVDLVVNNLDEGSHPFHLVRPYPPPLKHLTTNNSPARPPLLRPSNLQIDHRHRFLRSILRPIHRSISSRFRSREIPRGNRPSSALRPSQRLSPRHGADTKTRLRRPPLPGR